MRIDLNAGAAINLDKDAFIKLPRSLGDTIICTHGAVWVTEDKLPDDIELHQGDGYASKGAGTVFVQAFEQSTVRVVSRAVPEGRLARIAYQMAWAWRALRAETTFAR